MQPGINPYDRVFLVCQGEGPAENPDCGGGNPLLVFQALRAAVQAGGAADRTAVLKTTCLGFCEKGPNVVVYPGGAVYHRVQPADVPALVKAHQEVRH